MSFPAPLLPVTSVDGDQRVIAGHAAHLGGALTSVCCLAIVAMLSGCVAIPAGRIWQTAERPTKRITERQLVETRLGIAEADDGATVRAELAALVAKTEVAETRMYSDRTRRVVIGLLPGVGSGTFSNIDETGPVEIVSGQGGGSLGVAFVSLFCSPIATLLSPILEFRREWRPPSLAKDSLLCMVDWSLVGWAKSAREVPRQESVQPMASAVRQLREGEPLSAQRLALQIPETGFQTSTLTDEAGVAVFELPKLPVILSRDCSVEVSAPGAVPPPAPRFLRVSRTVVGADFADGLFASHRFPERIFTDLSGVDGLKAVPDAAPMGRAEAQVCPQSDGPERCAEISVAVHNSGRGPIYQLVARTRSEEKALDRHALFLGRVDPGKTMAGKIAIPITPDMRTGQYDVTVEFCEANRNEPNAVPLVLPVEGVPRPELDFSCQIEDDPGRGSKVVGNADGVVQKGEAFDLVVAVKNTGTETAQNVRVSVTLPEDPSLRNYGRAIQEVGSIQPDRFGTARFNISVKEWTKLPGVDVEVSVEEASFGEKCQRLVKLPFDARVPEQTVAVSRVYYVVDEGAVLRLGAGPDATEFARAPRGTPLHAIGELTDWIQVEMDTEGKDGKAKKRLWVRRRSVTDEAPGLTLTAQAAPVVVTRFGNRSPRITFVEPVSDLTTTEDRVSVVISVVDVDGVLKDVRMESGTSPDGLRGFGVIGKEEPATGRATDGAERVIRHTLALAMGPNLVRVTATDDHGQESSRTLTVRRTAKRGVTHLIAVGINTYREPYALSCACQDARRFAEFARDNLGVSGHNSHVLLDQQATSRGILSAFGRLRRDLKSEDTLIVFLAGHGVVDKVGDREDSYFLPVDAEPTDLFSTAIEMERFRRMLDVPAERILVIADLCHGGNIKLRGSAGALFQRLQGKGHILIGYAGPAREDSALGAGYLTHYLLEGLAGPADADRNYRITLREAYQYASEKIKKLTGTGLWIKGEGDLELTGVNR